MRLTSFLTVGTYNISGAFNFGGSTLSLSPLSVSFPGGIGNLFLIIEGNIGGRLFKTEDVGFEITSGRGKGSGGSGIEIGELGMDKGGGLGKELDGELGIGKGGGLGKELGGELGIGKGGGVGKELDGELGIGKGGGLGKELGD